MYCGPRDCQHENLASTPTTAAFQEQDTSFQPRIPYSTCLCICISDSTLSLSFSTKVSTSQSKCSAYSASAPSSMVSNLCLPDRKSTQDTNTPPFSQPAASSSTLSQSSPKTAFSLEVRCFSRHNHHSSGFLRRKKEGTEGVELNTNTLSRSRLGEITTQRPNSGGRCVWCSRSRSRELSQQRHQSDIEYKDTMSRFVVSQPKSPRKGT